MLWVGSTFNNYCGQRLHGHRYATFEQCGEEGKIFIRAYPLDPEDPVEVPGWLKLGNLVLGETRDLKWEHHTQRPSHTKICCGDVVCHPDAARVQFGTLGCMMRSQDEIFAITAGHVVDTIGWIAVLKHSTDETKVVAFHVSNRTPRVGFHPEVGILRVPREQAELVYSIIPRTNIYYYHDTNVHSMRTTFEMSYQMARAHKLVEIMAMGKAIHVFKNGITTGTTMGRLTRILWHYPPSWPSAHPQPLRLTDAQPSPVLIFDETEFVLTDLAQQTHQWLGLVQWTSPDNAFSAPGDSGSLVYSREKNQTVPLGILLGAPYDYPGHSIFLSLETYVIEGIHSGLELALDNA
jgi:hypothetical protein